MIYRIIINVYYILYYLKYTPRIWNKGIESDVLAFE